MMDNYKCLILAVDIDGGIILLVDTCGGLLTVDIAGGYNYCW